MEKLSSSGFREVEHTADWALEVWAPDLDELFVQAALGMYHLMDVHLADPSSVSQPLDLAAADDESLLVTFLAELLYLAESRRIAFDRIAVHRSGSTLRARLNGRSIASQERQIKAVTYHDLAISHTGGRVTVKIVFDV